MGLVHNQDEDGRHEGYAIGHVPRDWEPPAVDEALNRIDPWPPHKTGRWPQIMVRAYDDYEILRELGSRIIDHRWSIVGVRLYSAACSCGWRSPRHRVFTTATWWPSVLEFDQNTIEAGFCRDKIERMWTEHVDVELARP